MKINTGNMLFGFFKNFFNNYKYCECFYLPIFWLEKLNSEIELEKVKKRHIEKKIQNLLNVNYDVSIGLDIISKKCVIINICTKESKQLKEISSILKDNTNLYPFWIVFPNSFHGSPFWRQGIQEHYADIWLPHWVSLTKEQQQQCFKKYNASQDWREWLLENRESLKGDYLKK